MKTDRVYINGNPVPEPNATRFGVIGLLAAKEVDQTTLNQIRDLLVYSQFDDDEDDTIVCSHPTILHKLVVGNSYTRVDGQHVKCTGVSSDGYYSVGGYSYFPDGSYILNNTNLDIHFGGK